MRNIRQKGCAMIFSLLMVISAAGGGVVLGSSTAAGTSVDDSGSRTEQTRITGIAGTVNAAAQVDVDPSDLPGDGSQSNPYEISNASELQAIEDDLDANYTLVNDINASRTAQWNGGSGFAPIGGQFTGSFNGAGHKITNLTINRPSSFAVGIFANIDSGEIKNVSLIKVNIVGDGAVGSVAGDFNGGIVTNVSVTGRVDGGSGQAGGLIGQVTESDSKIIQSNTSVNVTGNTIAGGLVGYLGQGKLSNSYATGTISGVDQVGGLVGYDRQGTINNSYSTANVTGNDRIGGLVGRATDAGDTIANSYAAGNVTGNTEVGGLVGTSGSVDYSSSAVYWDIDTTDQKNSTGGDDFTEVIATGLETPEMIGEAARTNMSGLNFDGVWETQPSDYPILIWQAAEDDTTGNGDSDANTTFVNVSASDLPGSGTESDPYEISNASELQAMEDDLDANYTLVNDIDAYQTAQWNNGNGFDPIGGDVSDESTPEPFSGSLDGNNHAIHNLTIDRPGEGDIGLIGVVGSGGKITNVTLSGNITGNSIVGGLVGINQGIVRNIVASGSVTGDRAVGGFVGTNKGTVRNATVSINVTGQVIMGGLVGFNFDGTVRNVISSGSVNGSENKIGGLIGDNEGIVRNATASGSVNGSNRVGGLVGNNKADGAITDAFSTGNVTGNNRVGGLVGYNFEGTVENTFSAGNVTGSDRVGGLVGFNVDGTITDSYWDKQVTPDGDAVGLTTAQMTGEAARTNMTGLEFGTVWQSKTGDYPMLIAVQPLVSVIDSDTAPPNFTDITASGITGDGIVVSGEEVTIAANVSDSGSGVGSVVANASAFGAGTVSLDDTDNDGRYTGSFIVDESAAAAPDNTYEIPINATDAAGNVNESVAAGPLEFDDLDTTVSLTPTDQQLVSNNTATFDVVVDNATNGVGAWELTVSQAGDDVVNITSVSLSGEPDQQTVSFAPDDNSVDIDAALANTSDTGSVKIATITVTSDGSGSSVLDLDVTSLGTEAGFNYDVIDTENASLNTIETAPPELSVPTATGTGGDGIVVDEERVTVAVNVTDTQSGVGSVVANASSFGAGTVQLDDPDNDGRYNTTFTVDQSAAAQPNNAYQIPINATDNAGNTNQTVAAGPLELGSLDTAVSVVPTTQQVAVNNTTTFDVVVEDAVGGVGALALNVTQSGEATATITNVTLNGAPEQQTVSIAADNESVFVEAAGGDTADTGSITVATVTVAGDEIGNSVLDLNVTSIETEAGAEYNITATDEAQLTTTPPAIRSIYTGPPTDVDGDGQFEDINGNGNFTIVDVQALFASRESAAIQNYPARYNYNDIGDVDVVDVQRLFFELQQQERREEQDSA